MMKKNTYIIVGLGNPGPKYRHTRHNVGFDALDILFDMWEIKSYKRRFSALCAVKKTVDKKIILLKPLTYMNNSGQAVKKAAWFYRVPPEHIIVIYDDIDLPPGTLRIRKSGGPGTHNGMRSLVNQLRSQNFPRIRVGIGKSPTKEQLIEHVLSRPKDEERTILNAAIERSARAAQHIVEDAIEPAMQLYNQK